MPAFLAGLWPLHLAPAARWRTATRLIYARQRRRNVAHQLIDVRAREGVARRFDAHDRIARAKAQAIARGELEATVGEFIGKGRGEGGLHLGQQGAPLALGVAIGADADEEADLRLTTHTYYPEIKICSYPKVN